MEEDCLELTGKGRGSRSLEENQEKMEEDYNFLEEN